MPPPPTNRGMMYSDELRDLLNRIQATQDEMLKNQQRLEITLTALQNSVPSRTEIQVLLDQRLSTSVYFVEHEALKERVKDVEKRLDEQPGTAWNRAYMAITMVVSAAAMIVALITLLRG